MSEEEIQRESEMTRSKIPYKDWKRMVRSHFPEVRNRDGVGDFLWNCTAFPFAGTDQQGFSHYDKQLSELAEKVKKTGKSPFVIAHEELEALLRPGERNK